MSAEHRERQRRFYDAGSHHHLRPQQGDYYAAKFTARMAEALGLQPHHRVIEIGASFGRFTIPLLRHCASVLAVDLSARVIGELEATRDALGIEPARCRGLVADARELTLDDVGEPVDFVVGFFILHHVADVAGTIRAVSRLVAPGGGVGFIEPNRRNPLFLVQVMACQDMTWQEEKGMFTLSAAGIARGYREAGLLVMPVERFGFFPPQFVNQHAWARRLEGGLERSRLLEPVLPFVLVAATSPSAPSETGSAELL